MKRIYLILVLFFAFVLQFCTSHRAAISAGSRKITYVNHIQPIVMNSCSPCHIQPEGKAKPLDTYAAVKANIDTILARIQKKPNEKGFMPVRRPKLSDSTINVFARWKNNGFAQR